MPSTCKLCDDEFSPDDDTIDCDLCNEVEHITCHADNGHEWELIAAPGRAALARHSTACVELAMSEFCACGGEEQARDAAWQALDDGRYTCVCGVLERSGDR
jgi:hypothetical protein